MFDVLLRVDSNAESAPFDGMPYHKPHYSLNQVDKAAKYIRASRPESKLVDDPKLVESYVKLIDWRAAHVYPQNTIYITLNNRSSKIDENAIVSQRLKRFGSIMYKLYANQKMQLSQMQDIGGCRAVVGNVESVYRIIRKYNARPIKSNLVRLTDYIERPKLDGYRSIHMMYRFGGQAQTSPWAKLRIEIQIRTKTQHEWATAVEAVDLFSGQNLKQGFGNDDWKRFFALVGAADAIRSDTHLVPNCPDNLVEIRQELAALNNKLHAIGNLRNYRAVASDMAMRKSAYWFIITTNPGEGHVEVEEFQKEEMIRAQERYSELEQGPDKGSTQSVLVSTESLQSLMQAYPAYFADTGQFTQNVEELLAG